MDLIQLQAFACKWIFALPRNFLTLATHIFVTCPLTHKLQTSRKGRGLCHFSSPAVLRSHF